MAEIDVWIKKSRGTYTEYTPHSDMMRCTRVSSMVNDFTEGVILNTSDSNGGMKPLVAIIVFPNDDDPGIYPGTVVECRTLGCVRVRYTDHTVRTVMILTPTTDVMSCASLMEDITQFSEYIQERLRRAAMLMLAQTAQTHVQTGLARTSAVLFCELEGAVSAITTYVESVDPGVD